GGTDSVSRLPCKSGISDLNVAQAKKGVGQEGLSHPHSQFPTPPSLLDSLRLESSGAFNLQRNNQAGYRRRRRSGDSQPQRALLSRPLVYRPYHYPNFCVFALEARRRLAGGKTTGKPVVIALAPRQGRGTGARS